ncbi:hypothetical protein H9P43_007644 [Blastocladiella emersonii ATCC 22665]|nr:hypothetical protein H9P43_007644 [Blastocladiella emersonii ATCC 22665]
MNLDQDPASLVLNDLPREVLERLVSVAVPRGCLVASSATLRHAVVEPHVLRTWVAHTILGVTAEVFESAGRDANGEPLWHARETDEELSETRQLQMPLVWYLKLRLLNDSHAHPFPPSLLAHFLRKNQPRPASVVDALAPFVDLRPGTDALFDSFAFRAAPEGFSLLDFFLRAGDLDAMFACLDHLAALFPTTLCAERAKITTWSRLWLLEDRFTRTKFEYMDKIHDLNTDAPIDISYPVTFPMALALAAMTLWNHGAVKRLLDGDYGIDRVELMRWFSRGNTAAVFLDALDRCKSAAHAVPGLLNWLGGQGWVCDRDRHPCFAYYVRDHDYEFHLVSGFDEEVREDLMLLLLRYLDQGHYDLISLFAKSGIINDHATWAMLLAYAIGDSDCAASVAGYVKAFVPHDEHARVLVQVYPTQHATWQRPNVLYLPALFELCAQFDLTPQDLLDSHLGYYATFPSVTMFLLTPSDSRLEPRRVVNRAIDWAASSMDSNAREAVGNFLVDVCARTSDEAPPMTLSALLDLLYGRSDDVVATRAQLVIQLAARIFDSIVDPFAASHGIDDDSVRDTVFAALDELVKQYPHNGVLTGNVAMSAATALTSRFTLAALTSMDPSTAPSAGEASKRRLFTLLAKFNVGMMARAVFPGAFMVPWVVATLLEAAKDPTMLNAGLPPRASDSLTLRAVLDGKYELACTLLRIFPPSDTFKQRLSAMVKAKNLREAKEKVLDVFGIE